jgi:hypothetical protein
MIKVAGRRGSLAQGCARQDVMARVPTLQSWKEAGPYLQMLKGTIAADIRPLLDLPGNAPFAICREVLSYVDHLGHLYCGKGQVGDRSREFMRQILAKVDPNYGRRAADIYQMFRCGTIHEFQPKVLENKAGELLVWECYAGLRADSFEEEGRRVQVVHLVPYETSRPGIIRLPVSTRCLIDDLMISMELFEKAGPENERLTAWNRAARELASPTPHEFSLK